MAFLEYFAGVAVPDCVGAPTERIIVAALGAACPNEQLCKYMQCCIAQKVQEERGMIPRTSKAYPDALNRLLDFFVKAVEWHRSDIKNDRPAHMARTRQAMTIAPESALVREAVGEIE